MADSASMKDHLLTKIEDRTAVIGVIGLGYVGLPLALEFVHAGFRVIGYDISQRVIDQLMAGRSHIQDIPDATVQAAVATGSFVATNVETRIGE
ncbi:MAG: NAD(P)-binding domain-containing protein, partial [Gemmatimonadota bacterium]|nr:NAD(P)-binding domain-containing protein [Gemmatimonadota bacterium]